MADGEGNMQISDGANGDRVVRVNYPSNSNKSRDEKAKTPPKSEKKVEKIITGEVTERKKGLGRKIADTFTGENMHSVGLYILHEVVIPQVKTIISDAISQGTDRTLFGESRRSSSQNRYNSTGSRTNYTSYSRYSNNSSPVGRAAEPDGPRMSQRARQTHDFSEIVLDNRGDAEEVIDTLGGLIQQYQVTTVSDLYDLVGITGSFTDEKWGWNDLRDARIRRVSGGYLLDLPRPIAID